jgi:hypothetical protein
VYLQQLTADRSVCPSKLASAHFEDRIDPGDAVRFDRFSAAGRVDVVRTGLAW